MKKLLLLIIGKPSSGKSYAAEFIKKRFRTSAVHSGDVVREEIRRRGWPYTPETDRKIAEWFNQKGREKLIMKRSWVKLNKKNKILVIEGLRSKTQLRYLEIIAKMRPAIIRIDSPFNVRVQRLIKRGRFGKLESAEYLRRRDRSDKSHGLWGLLKLADYSIGNNNVTKKQFENRIQALVRSLLAKDN